MAITVVRTTTTPARTATATSQAASFAALPAAGNAIVVFAWGWTSNADPAKHATCADNQTGNTYTREGDVITLNDRWGVVLRALNIGTPSGTFTVTVTSGQSAGSMVAVAVEVSGLSNTGQPDVALVSATGTGTAPAPGNMTTVSALTYLALLIVSDTGGTSTDVVKPTGTTSRYLEQDGNTYEKGGAADQINSSTGTFNPTWTTLSGAWSALQVAYKAAAGAPILSPAAILSHL